MVERIKKLKFHTSSLWLGPRQSGKSTLLRCSLKNKKYIEFNLLEQDTYNRFLKDPSQFRLETEFQIKKNKIQFVFVDEIQKVPSLTNEVHNLIEKYPGIHFILSGSSARKLKRGQANLLGGRAIVEHLLPLVFEELKTDFHLNTVLQYGSLVGLYYAEKELRIQKLRAYVDTYLKEEIAQEGLVRNFDLFNRFLEVAGLYFAEIINYTNIGRETGTTVKTVQNYFSILHETMLSFELSAWDRSLKRQLSKHSKFYFVDNGIVNAINSRLVDPLDSLTRGRLFEQWLINEIRTHVLYTNKEEKLYFWRTGRGEFEVDLVISKNQTLKSAFEFKAKKTIQKKDILGLLELSKEYPKVKLYCVCECPRPFMIETIEVLPYQKFLTEKFF